MVLVVVVLLVVLAAAVIVKSSTGSGTGDIALELDSNHVQVRFIYEGHWVKVSGTATCRLR